MTTQQLDGINEKPDAACESCGSPDEKTPLFVDHLGGPICLKCMALKFAQVAELQKFDEQTKYSEKEHFVAEYMLDRGFKMLNDDGTVYGCTLRHIITMLTNYSAPHFTTDEDLDKVPGAQVVDATWLKQLRDEHLASYTQVQALQKECEALVTLRAQVNSMTALLRNIVIASGVDLDDCNVDTAGPDLMALGQDVVRQLMKPQSVFPMETAPTDGTRVLILNRQHGYDSKLYRYVPHGEAWVECWFTNGKWEEWCGSFKITSSATIDPIEWAHLPEAHNKCPVADAWAQPANFGQAPDTGVHCTAHVDYDPASRISPKAEDDGKL